MRAETSVSFSCGNERLQRVYDTAEEKCRGNLKRFGRDLVLVEGGGYESQGFFGKILPKRRAGR